MQQCVTHSKTAKYLCEDSINYITQMRLCLVVNGMFHYSRIHFSLVYILLKLYIPYKLSL